MCHLPRYIYVCLALPVRQHRGTGVNISHGYWNGLCTKKQKNKKTKKKQQQNIALQYHIGLGHETMVCAVCLSIFLWIRDMARLLRGTFLSLWYLPRIWPSVLDTQHYYHASYHTDDWHLAYMFSQVYFSVEVCPVGVFPHSVGTRRDPCVRVHPLTRKQTRTGDDPALHLRQVRGHLNWRMGLPALLGGNLGWLYCTVYGVCHRQGTLWPYGRVLF